MMLFFLSILLADIGPFGFLRYRNDCFVETGTCYGGAVFTALRSGFKEIYSIEKNPIAFDIAKRNLGTQGKVKLRLGDSATELWDIIKGIDKPITFWLDAHRFPPLEDGEKNCPLLEELEQIRCHPIKTHTILIDDMSCCGSLDFDYITKEDLIRKILEINPAYRISFIDGGEHGEAKNNVLVATIFPR